MANVTIRNIDEAVIASLKAQAKANHRSLEGEIRHLLAQQVLRWTRLKEFRGAYGAAPLADGKPPSDR